MDFLFLRFSRIKITILAFIIVAISLAQPMQGNCTDSSQTNIGKSLDIKQTILTPAVQNLQLASVGDPALLSWLDLLILRTPLVSNLGPSAFAKMDNGLPVVQIDNMFILHCFHVSDLASLLMANPPGDVMFAVGKRYGIKVGESIRKGEQPPSIDIDLGSLSLDPAKRVVAEHMGYLTFGAAIQWVILHEIGHHQLKHFDRNPKDLTESRRWELDADTWAIQKMQHLGYSLDPLLAVMEAFYIEGEMRRSFGLAIAEESSTHPSWERRIKNLKRFDVKKPSSFGKWIIIAEVSSKTPGGEIFWNELLIPRRPMPGILGQYHQFGRVVYMPIAFFDDGSIHLYGRTSEELSEVVVSNLGSLYPDIKFRNVNMDTGQVSESNTRGYQMDMASAMSSPLKVAPGFTVRDVLLTDPITFFKQYLLSVESRPQVVVKAIRIQEQLLSDVNTLLLEYARGLNSLEIARKMIDRVAIKKSKELKLLLGDDRFISLQDKMLANPITARSLEKFLDK